MAKEMHIHLCWVELDLPDHYFTFSGTKKAFAADHEVIHTTQIHFCNTDVLDRGYRLFIHFKDRIEEIGYGQVKSTPREIRRGQNLEKMLLSGEFGEI